MKAIAEMIDKATPYQMVVLYKEINKELKSKIEENKKTIRTWKGIERMRNFHF